VRAVLDRDRRVHVPGELRVGELSVPGVGPPDYAPGRTEPGCRSVALAAVVVLLATLMACLVFL
jgi:hypothetical protein